ncbi:MAG: hypothetical protein WDZ82_00515 [Candidatus Paceibacterota bacterium]
MAKKVYYYVVSMVFFVVMLLHLARIVYSWDAVVGGAVIPLWVSWAAVVIAGYLCARGWMFAKNA